MELLDSKRITFAEQLWHVQCIKVNVQVLRAGARAEGLGGMKGAPPTAPET
jgi:hypothetical protein